LRHNLAGDQVANHAKCEREGIVGVPIRYAKLGFESATREKGDDRMKRQLRTLGPILVILCFATIGAQWVHAQIIDEIQAHLDHSFVVGNTTLPPGDYIFRVAQDSELAVMTVTSANGKTVVDVLVQQTTADHTPVHSELTFRKYGNTEFLNKIFERGSKDGAQVTETGRQEEHFVKEHLQATEHTEVQK